MPRLETYDLIRIVAMSPLTLTLLVLTGVTFWQTAVDQFFANGVPAGHGPVCGSGVVDGWAAPAAPPTWTDADTVRLRALLDRQPRSPSPPDRCPELAEPLGAQAAPVREVVVAIPAPRGDHRQHEGPAVAHQISIDARIVLADLLRRMGEVEFHRPTATRLEVDEQRPVRRAEHVAGMRLAVQELAGAAALTDHPAQPP